MCSFTCLLFIVLLTFFFCLTCLMFKKNATVKYRKREKTKICLDYKKKYHIIYKILFNDNIIINPYY